MICRLHPDKYGFRTLRPWKGADNATHVKMALTQIKIAERNSQHGGIWHPRKIVQAEAGNKVVLIISILFCTAQLSGGASQNDKHLCIT